MGIIIDTDITLKEAHYIEKTPLRITRKDASTKLMQESTYGFFGCSSYFSYFNPIALQFGTINTLIFYNVTL